MYLSIGIGTIEQDLLTVKVMPDNDGRQLPVVSGDEYPLTLLQMHTTHWTESRAQDVLLRELKDAIGLLEANRVTV